VELLVDGQTHIAETNLDLEPGGFNVLLGTTLAGKTTLMRLMAGLIRPSAGEIWFNGAQVTGTPVQKRNLSMVYQQFINYPNLSVFENIASPLRLAGLRGAEIKRRVDSVAELLRLTAFLRRRPAELSGGQQQRCAIARALAKDSDLVLLDEPLANLDYKLREELREELPRLFEGRNPILVYATTEPSEALLLGGHTAALHEGRVTQFGPTGDLYRRPADLITAQVFSDPPINTVPISKVGPRFVLEDGGGWEAQGPMAPIADGRYRLGVRAHHVHPVQDHTSGAVLEGRVLVSEISGSESLIHFSTQGRSWVSLAHGVHTYQVGETARFRIATEHAMLFTIEGALVMAPAHQG
jgi:glycerol transport system ATP-binding protein